MTTNSLLRSRASKRAQKQVTLSPDEASQEADVQLNPDKQTESVTVSANPTKIDLTSSNGGGTVLTTPMLNSLVRLNDDFR